MALRKDNIIRTLENQIKELTEQNESNQKSNDADKAVNVPVTKDDKKKIGRVDQRGSSRR